MKASAQRTVSCAVIETIREHLKTVWVFNQSFTSSCCTIQCHTARAIISIIGPQDRQSYTSTNSECLGQAVDVIISRTEMCRKFLVPDLVVEIINLLLHLVRACHRIGVVNTKVLEIRFEALFLNSELQKRKRDRLWGIVVHHIRNYEVRGHTTTVILQRP